MKFKSRKIISIASIQIFGSAAKLLMFSMITRYAFSPKGFDIMEYVVVHPSSSKDATRVPGGRLEILVF
jgi:hypothetical protein